MKLSYLPFLFLLASCGPASTSGVDIPEPEKPTDYWDIYVTVLIDPVTKCEYVRIPRGGVTPRLKPDGTQICDGTENVNDANNR
jgi:hypothetical protein